MSSLALPGLELRFMFAGVACARARDVLFAVCVGCDFVYALLEFVCIAVYAFGVCICVCIAF